MRHFALMGLSDVLLISMGKIRLFLPHPLHAMFCRCSSYIQKTTNTPTVNEGEGCRFFCSLKLPYFLNRMSQHFCHQLKVKNFNLNLIFNCNIQVHRFWIPCEWCSFLSIGKSVHPRFAPFFQAFEPDELADITLDTIVFYVKGRVEGVPLYGVSGALGSVLNTKYIVKHRVQSGMLDKVHVTAVEPLQY